MVDVAMVDDCDFGGSHAECGAGCVHGGVAASDDRYLVSFSNYYFFLGDEALIVKGDPTEEPHSLAHTRMATTFYLKGFGSAGAGAHEDGVETFLKKAVDGVVLADSGTIVDFYAEVFNFFDLTADNLFGKTVFGDSKHQDTSRFDSHLKNFDVETLSGEVAGYSQSGGS